MPVDADQDTASPQYPSFGDGSPDATQETWLQAVIDSTTDMVWAVEPGSFGLLWWNRSVHDHFTTRAPACLRVGALPEELGPPEAAARWRALYRRALAEGPFTITQEGHAGSRTLELSFNILRREGSVTGISVFGRNISERRCAEEALRRSEERYRRLFQQANEGIALADARDGTLLDCNEAMLALTGYRHEDLIGQPQAVLHPPEPGNPRLSSSFRNRLASGSEDARRELMRARSGQTLEVEIRGSLIDVDGRPCMLGLFRDVTEQHRAQAALQASEERFHQVLRAAGGYVWELDADLRVVYSSDEVAAIVGYGPEDLLGRSPLEFLIPGQEEEVRALVEALVQGHNPIRHVDLRHRSASGEAVWLRVSAAPIRDREGRFAGARGFCLDVTDRVVALEALQRSEERYRKIVEMANEGIALADDQFRIVFLNQRLADMLGCSREEVLGRRLEEYCLPEARECMRAELEERRLGRPGAYEVRFRRKDGGETCAIISGAPLLDETGCFTGALAMLTDVTARRRSEEENRRLQAQLEQSQKIESVGRLAGGVAHDFNNLLTPLIGYSDLLLRRTPADDPHRQYLLEISRMSERAAALTRQLLAFSRRQVLQPRVVDLNAAVDGLMRMLKRLIGEDIHITTRLDWALWPVLADPGQIEQVIINLAVNARDAMPRGGTLSIETRNLSLSEAETGCWAGMAPGDYVTLAVADTGVGMDEATMARVFEPFFTTKEPGKGTGLGLSTVYGIVAQSGGTVTVQSRPGDGSRFAFALPRAVGVATAAADAPAAGAAPGRETILLVEDDQAVRDLVRQVLSGLGYQVLAAADGDEAIRIESSHSGPMDLLLTDVVMPRMGGPSLAEALCRARPDLRVLFMSGYTDHAILSSLGGSTKPALLHKPFAPHALAAKVRETLDAEPITREGEPS